MKKVTAILAVMILSACGGSGGGGNNDQIPEDFSPFLGTYNMTFISTITGLPDGTTCSDAVTILTIDPDGVMESSLYSEQGDLYQLSAVALDSGEVVAGNVTFYDGVVYANFSGTVQEGGDWVDLFGCEGIWQATKQ